MNLYDENGHYVTSIYVGDSKLKPAGYVLVLLSLLYPFMVYYSFKYWIPKWTPGFILIALYYLPYILLTIKTKAINIKWFLINSFFGWTPIWLTMLVASSGFAHFFFYVE